MTDERDLAVLVLGVGGNVSQGILKALSAGGLRCRMVAGCITPLAVGLYLADRSYVTPPAASSEFIPWLERACSEERIDAVLSGSEPVLESLAANSERVRERTGALCIVAPPAVLEVGQDKLRTATWLDDHGFRAPRTVEAKDRAGVRRLAAECGLPLVAKPRWLKGSQDVAVIASDEELDLVIGHPELVVQEHLPGDDDEYTVGCVCDSHGELQGSLAMRRRLESGTTYQAEVGDFPEVIAYAEEVARALRAPGPLNIQLRLVEGAPVAFEFNVRFSGTTPVRARFGFNEVEATLRHFVLGEPLSLGAATPGRMLRYWNEVYIPEENHRELERTGRLEDPRRVPPSVESWGMEA